MPQNNRGPTLTRPAGPNGRSVIAFDDAGWTRVDLPHDWSADGPFSAEFGSGAVSAASAKVRVETTIDNRSDGTRGISLESEIVLRGTVVARSTTPSTVGARGSQTLAQDIDVARPERWSPESPALYVVRQRIRSANVVTDDVETTFGIRTIRFDPGTGFFLNEQPIKLKGVCVHHDAGSVGAAVPEAVWERRLRALKDIGINAIRTSHNPPAPEFLDLCDRLGLLVKDEAFDEFTPPKNKWVNGWNAGVPSRFGYGESFAQWAVTDAVDMIKRDRNHPSIVMWSIGNGDLKSIENGKDVAHRTYQGRGLVILRITDRPATVTVKASSPGLEAATVVLSPMGVIRNRGTKASQQEAT